jgi:hypothetical protein
VFVFAYSVWAQLEYAFVPDVRLVPAKPWPYLILDSSDYIYFGIALLDYCLDASPSFYSALHACGFICGYLDIGTRPRHRPRQPLARLLMTHKYRGCIVVLSINKSVEPNEEQKVLMSGFDQGFTVNTSKQVFRGIW